MQLITVLGFLIGIGAIFFGNLLEGGHPDSLIQATAALIVFGGTFGAVMVSSRAEDIKLAARYFKKIFRNNDVKERSRIAEEIVQSARLARKESILSLQNKITGFSDPFMRSIFRFVIDGADADAIRRVFQDEIEITERKHLAAAKVWSDAGGFAPTIGIIGAILGLIHVMANLTDTSSLGQGIAVAFVATIYGVASANLIFLPISNKLKTLIRYRTETEQMVLEGAIAVVSGMNPYLIEQKVQAFKA